MPTITLPTFHAAQVKAFHAYQAHRFFALCAGRRFGKGVLLQAIACDTAIRGGFVCVAAPDYKITAEFYNDVAGILDPVIKAASKVEGVIRLKTGGRIDFWTLENERAGRSRSYDVVGLDEAAFAKPNVVDIWEKSLKPTLLDRRGRAIVMSNANGISDDNWFYNICNDPKHGFVMHQAPSRDNPHLPLEELDALKLTTHPLVYEQEYEAKFVDFSGAAFFSRDNLLSQGHALPYPKKCDAVYATIDTAVKDTMEHDGTAVVYWAVSKHGDFPLYVLDWDIIQMEGSLLEAWLPSVYSRLLELSTLCNARMGSAGTFIEDKVSGSILIQQAKRKNWRVFGIDSALTSVGKDARAISVSGYVYSGKVKLCIEAHDKIIQYKGSKRNHLESQVFGFRVGDKDTHKRPDDLLDAFCYGVAIGLGNKLGF